MSDKHYYAPYLTRRQALSDTLSDTFANLCRFLVYDVTIQNDYKSRNRNGLRRITSRLKPVEAAGIEPASRDISMWASTCVVGSLMPSPKEPPTDGVKKRLAGSGF